MPGTSVGLGGMETFNMQHGFVEAVVRGFRSGFVPDESYNHLSQCDTLEDLKMNLQETDYGTALQNDAALSPPLLEQRALQKLVTEFIYLRAQAVEPLASFLDYITFEYMIENIMLLLRGTISGRNVNELMAQCHPLGMFSESTMRQIPGFEASPRGYADLYETVLVDTPVGVYFQRYINTQSKTKLSVASDVRGVLEEVQLEILKHSVLKLYLEDFYRFCLDLGGETAAVMGGLLRTRADRHAINITLNSFHTPLNEPATRDTFRRQLYPSFGDLYPEGTELLQRADDEAKLSQAVAPYALYREIFERLAHAHSGSSGSGSGSAGISGHDEVSVDDEFYRHEVKMYELAFESQMHFGVFYAYVKLKEHEIRNLVWIAECILQRRKDQIGKYVPIFSKTDSRVGGGGNKGH